MVSSDRDETSELLDPFDRQTDPLEPMPGADSEKQRVLGAYESVRTARGSSERGETGGRHCAE